MPFSTEDLADAVDLDGLAAALQVSRRTAERIVRAGDIDSVRTGTGRGVIKIPQRAITDYIARRTVKAVPPSHVRVVP